LARAEKKCGATGDVVAIGNLKKVSTLKQFTNFKKLVGFLIDVAIIEV
jgi:hypothetical protein